MSWSIALIGKPDNVANALIANSEKLSGQSKVEFDSALPHMIALVKENFGNGDGAMVRIEASGHGYATPDGQQQRSLQCKIEGFYGLLV